jgi:hypothetical protein
MSAAAVDVRSNGVTGLEVDGAWLDCCGHASTCVVGGRCCCGDVVRPGVTS